MIKPPFTVTGEGWTAIDELVYQTECLHSLFHIATLYISEDLDSPNLNASRHAVKLLDLGLEILKPLASRIDALPGNRNPRGAHHE